MLFQFVVEGICEERVSYATMVSDAERLHTRLDEPVDEIVDSDIGIRAYKKRVSSFKVALGSRVNIERIGRKKKLTFSSFTVSMIVFVLPVPGG
jgi:hypothetical protein